MTAPDLPRPRRAPETRRARRAAYGAAVALGAALLIAALAPRAEARPTYFQVFTGHYGITSEDRLYACGVCHYLWTGTGARNPYGSAVEQQLYLGKSILQSIQDVEAADTDGDGFTNVDEILAFMTLPGYSCANFHEAIGAPLDYHTYITPMVASCLEPLDIRIAPASITFLTAAGTTGTVPLTIFNNGSDFPLEVSSYELLPGSHATLGVAGPPAPFEIPLGQSVVLDVQFSPEGAVFATGTLRIASNDPDEDTIDVPITGLGFVPILAPADERARCLREVDKAYQRYGKKHLREWGRCYLDEVSGLACQTGRRDLKLQQAEVKLRAAIGGAKDRRCAGAGLSPSLLGLPAACGGSCGAITVNSFTRLVDCLACRQDEAMRDMLREALGTAPPDLPPNTVGGPAARCQKQLLAGVQKGIGKLQKALGRCELANVTAPAPADCPTALAGEIATILGRVQATILRCGDTAGLLGCLFEPPANPSCLADATLAIGSDLVGAAFGTGQ